MTKFDLAITQKNINKPTLVGSVSTQNDTRFLWGLFLLVAAFVLLMKESVNYAYFF